MDVVYGLVICSLLGVMYLQRMLSILELVLVTTCSNTTYERIIRFVKSTSSTPPPGILPWRGQETAITFTSWVRCASDEVTSFTLAGTHTSTKEGVDKNSHRATSSRSYPCPSLPTIMQKLGHSYVDLVKADGEGMEWQLFEHLASSHTCMGPLLVELHFWHPKVPQNMVAWLRSILIPLEKLGYFIIQTVEAVAAKIEAYEVTFLNANWSAETAFGSTNSYYPYNASMYPSTPNVDIP